MLKKIEKKIKACSLRMDKLVMERDAILSETPIRCGGCEKEFPIKDAIFIQTHYYVSPYSCSGGDYWLEDEAEVGCVHCGTRLRMNKHPELAALKRLFKEVKDEHNR